MPASPWDLRKGCMCPKASQTLSPDYAVGPIKGITKNSGLMNALTPFHHRCLWHISKSAWAWLHLRCRWKEYNGYRLDVPTAILRENDMAWLRDQEKSQSWFCNKGQGKKGERLTWKTSTWRGLEKIWLSWEEVQCAPQKKEMGRGEV